MSSHASYGYDESTNKPMIIIYGVQGENIMPSLDPFVVHKSLNPRFLDLIHDMGYYKLSINSRGHGMRQRRELVYACNGTNFESFEVHKGRVLPSLGVRLGVHNLLPCEYMNHLR